MSPRIRCCALCGWIVYDDEGSVSWMNQFRGLYSCSDGIAVTGVGRYTDPRGGVFIAPRDPNARWDDAGYEHPAEDEFAVMHRFEINGKRGYIFHDACWSLLGQAFAPAPVPLERLFDVCDSVPLGLTGDALNWGHDYGALTISREKDLFPWENWVADREYLEEVWFDTPHGTDPLAIAEVDKMLAETPRPPPEKHFSFTISAPFSGSDPFTSLPLELCSAIAEHMPTPDFLNSRLASRSFWSVFHNQQFWASRFRGNSDRSWLFEAGQQKGTSRNWRGLYHCTVDSRLGRGLRNRKRIWDLIQHVAAILKLRWNQPPAELLPEGLRDWLLVAGSMGHQQPKGFSQLEQGCWRLRSMQIAIPDGLSQVSAWTVRVGNREYIAGLLLGSASGEVLRLGYSSAGERRSVQLSGLAGFNVAVGLGGIHGLQSINGTTKEPSAWLGCPDNSPKTERLAVGAQVTALEVGFDGFKMVSIAVSPRPDTGRVSGHDSLRRSAIWYPDVPPQVLDLNDDFCMAPQAYTWGFRPLFWACFGGPGGIYLPHLTKITARGGDRLLRLDFSFDSEEVPDECRRFGRIEGDEDTTHFEFLIDGPGGEVVDKVVVFQEFPPEEQSAAAWLRREGVMAWLKVSTNRGRECYLGTRIQSRRRPIVRREISAAPGSAITGFFGAQYRYLEACINTLGVITEPFQKS